MGCQGREWKSGPQIPGKEMMTIVMAIEQLSKSNLLLETHRTSFYSQIGSRLCSLSVKHNKHALLIFRIQQSSISYLSTVPIFDNICGLVEVRWQYPSKIFQLCTDYNSTVSSPSPTNV